MKNKKKNNSFKKFIAKLHLWLGLGSGLIVFIVAVTGCIFVFHDEIKDITRDYRKVTPEASAYVAPSNLQKKTKSLFPEAQPGMVVYQGSDRSAFVYTLINEVPYHIYFNPYSAEFLQKENLENDFFLIVEDLHMHLWLPPEIGKQVIGISTLIFIFMLVSGIILWWPKKRKNLKKRLKIKWNAKWRRLNYDWHSVTGLYISLIALFVAITGLSFSYEWMNHGLYDLANLWQEKPEDQLNIQIESANYSEAAMDIALAETLKLKPGDEMFFVWEQGGSAPITTGSYPDALDYDHQSNFYFHPETGALLKDHDYSSKSAGMKLQEMTYGLHTGQYFGLIGKIIAFFASLFVAALPVTGFMIWFGRRNKKQKNRS
ncbi:PepSY-associated TM helix domain-containing protein [Salegentibacter mishustinae]|uniref:Peptidase n=1 Tax=Salegentibacter mishustinae TaxID=270918 RepID=A0A0Q9ZAR6_9FLAO|nr:PepSY-associated TM helix domain-containing protein [Salegentibacter mishustinae]KRG30096.1 peptidase [Salegentibacter mishustinae]PNW19522.1 peptidase [Salegentibacter mishustinae]PZX62024.1 putative iron-regulated membrane protein [Salegentibacter mishustinae]GGW95084.1 membrane protein [Salegentibacter mishustinae]